MEKEITIGVSNRHIHLNEETYNLLFDEPLEVDRELTQPGYFASKQKVTLKTDNYEIPNVRILGPFRLYNQVEISHNDALKFKLNPPVRASGDLDGAEEITVKTDKAEVKIKGCIIAERHIHISKNDALELGLEDKQIVSIKIPGIKSGIIDAHVKVSDEAFFEAHIDTDDANAFIINNENNVGRIIF